MKDKQNQVMDNSLPEKNSFLKTLLDPQGYGLAVIIALVLHAVVIALFAIKWPEEKRQVAEPTPKNIQAKVIQVENKAVKKRKETAQKRLAKQQRDAKRRQEAQRKKKIAAAKATSDKAARDKANKAKLAKEKAKQEKARQDKTEKDKLAAKNAEELERQKQQEREDALFEKQQEQELLNALAVEEQQRSMEKALAEEQRAQKNEMIKASFSAQIKAKIESAWRYPPSARPDMRVEVKFQLVPTGEVVSVTIVKSSGNEALDRSVLAAVKRAQPLPVTKDIRLFEQEFRTVIMGFSPKDAVW